MKDYLLNYTSDGRFNQLGLVKKPTYTQFKTLIDIIGCTEASVVCNRTGETIVKVKKENK